jgi:hypothetical protein
MEGCRFIYIKITRRFFVIYLFPVVCDGDPVRRDVKTFWGEGAPHEVTPLLKKLSKDFSNF